MPEKNLVKPLSFEEIYNRRKEMSVPNGERLILNINSVKKLASLK